MPAKSANLIGLVIAAQLLSAAPVAAQNRFQQSQTHMGARFEIVLYAATESDAERAFDSAFQRAAQIDGSMSDYDPESELSRLSRASPTSEPLQLSNDLFLVLELALGVSALSEGAFDVTVGPLTRLWRRARRRRQFPDPDRLTLARESVGYRHLQIDRATRAASLGQPRMRLDLGGIAKGFAAGQMLIEINKHGIEQALVNSGGDIAMSQAPPGSSGWKVGVQPLGEDSGDSVFAVLSETTVATSGDVWQFVEINGTRYSHIVDPRTGLGTTRPGGVTVVAPDGALSDALASALSVMDIDAGFALVEQYAGASARIVWSDGRESHVRCSPGFPQLMRP